MSPNRPDGPADASVGPANPARMYDYFLGGAANFANDRALAEQVLAVEPDAARIARANRAFLGRAVRFLVGEGIDQFLDLGSGVPTADNVHQVAHRANPGARVVYVDHEPVAAAYAAELVADEPLVATVEADLVDTTTVLARAAELLDLDRPVAVLCVAALHFVPDAVDPAAVVARYRDALAPGSHLVLSHGTEDGRPGVADRGSALYTRSTQPLVLRSRADVTVLLDGFTVLPPGIVFTPEWRTDGAAPTGPFADSPAGAGMYAAVGRLDA